MGKRKAAPGPDGLIYEHFTGKRNKRTRKVEAPLRARDPYTGRFVVSDAVKAYNVELEAKRRESKEGKLSMRVREPGKPWRNWKKGDTRKGLQVGQFQGGKLKAIIHSDFAKRTKKTLGKMEAEVTYIGRNKVPQYEFSGQGQSIKECLDPIEVYNLGYGGMYAWECLIKVQDGEEIRLHADGVEDFRSHYSVEEIDVLKKQGKNVSHGLPQGETYLSVFKHNVAHKIRQAFSGYGIRFSSLQTLERLHDPKRWNHFPGAIVADALHSIWAAKDQVYNVKFYLSVRVLKPAASTKIRDLKSRVKKKAQKKE